MSPTDERLREEPTVNAPLAARGSGDVGDPPGQWGIGGAHAGCSSGSAVTRTLVNS